MNRDLLATNVESNIDGRATAEQQLGLENVLRSNPNSVSDYVTQMRLHALLNWHHGNVASRAAQTLQPAPQLRRKSFTRGAAWSAIAATLLLVASWTIYHSMASGDVAVVERSAGVGAPATGTKLIPGPLQFEGEILARFDSGTTVILTGKVDAEVVDAMTLRVNAGSLTARLEPGGKVGFTVQTPAANVVDLSTEFGVDVQDGQLTNVVVFEGAVEIQSQANTTQSPAKVVRGEAVRFGPTGESRIMAIHRQPGFSAWSTQHGSGSISEVSDNLAADIRQKCYQIVPTGLKDGALAYGDRDYTWQSVPKQLIGADLVMTFNDDKRHPDLEVVVKLTAPAQLLVFTDDRAAAPGWLEAAGFVTTNLKLNQHETSPSNQTRSFSVWRKNVVAAGAIVLGANDAKSMYGIAVVLAESAVKHNSP